MIPAINNLPQLQQDYARYIEALRNSAFSGDIEDRYEARLLCATDNSVYQCMPQAVIFPKSCEDISIAVKLAADFPGITFAPRGGGTGTNGQSLNKGVMIDSSRHMKFVRELNPARREITVGAGSIKDELNELLRPHGLFFSPELSTSSRATVGGMISNDAAGQGSLKYGRTSTHIKKVKVVLRDGSIAEFGPVSSDALKAKLALNNLEGELYRQCYPLLKANAAKVREVFPKLNRFMTGYDLCHSYDPETDTVNLARLVCGAEGTLCYIAEATLDLTRIPTYRALLVIKYDSFVAALRQANDLVRAGALSVETVDSKVLNLAKQDPIWVQVSEYIQEVPGHEIQGINIVEFSGYDAANERALLDALNEKIQAQAKTFDKGVLGAQITDTKAGIAAVYGMRKKSVALLNSASLAKKLVPFTEDTVVPPENLADYIIEFRALLDRMEVEYGMFGHVDTGLMHVRPALDLTDLDDRRKLLEISRGVVALVRKYKGQMWGEHGRGYRAVFGELFFKELYPVARRIKFIFDPDNIFNPGKICVPEGSKASLVAIDGPMRGDLDRTIPVSVRNSFAPALSCNGNGQCFSYSSSSLMCPSYRYTRDHVRSPKGYSGLMREWLRLMTERNVNVITEEIEAATAHLNPVTFVKRALNTLNCKDDFNHDYLKNIQTCLACKSCKTQCPAAVNVADLNSRFLSLYYTRYLRPRMDLVTLNAEFLLPKLARFPRLQNALQGSAVVKSLVKACFSFVDVPEFSPVTMARRCRQEGFKLLSLARAADFDAEVLIVTDPFTVSYDVEGLIALAKLVRAMGFKVQFLRPYVNGKLRVIRGDRRGFAKQASKQAARLELLAAKGKTLLGYDPALTICYRDEYKSILGEARGHFEVLLPEEWLVSVMGTERYLAYEAGFKAKLQALAKSDEFRDDWYLFCHCTENALLPRATLNWQQAMAHFGLKLLPVPVACCGMAGLHGHLAQNQDETRAVYERNWKEKIQSRAFERCLVTGFSCRDQVKRMEGKRANHPIQVLCNLLTRANV